MTRRILIVANKSWEVDPLLAVLTSDYGRPSPFPKMIPPPVATVTMGDGTPKSIPARMAFASATAVCEVWCIKDLMDPAKSQASSEEKGRVLPSLAAAGSPPELVIAFGTAATEDARSYNGSVVVGSKAYVHNPYAESPNPQSNWNPPIVDRVIEEDDPSVSKQIILLLGGERRPFVEQRLLRPPLNPADPPVLLPSSAAVALSNVNITDPDNYVWADEEVTKAFSRSAGNNTVGSIETTHGVIRLVLPSPQFLFVSGIADRLGYFNMEVGPRLYAQNFVAAHNAGVAMASMVPALMQ